MPCSLRAQTFRTNVNSHKVTSFDFLYSFCKKVKVKVTLVQALRLCTGRTTHRGVEV